jgi:transcription initiation factor TFIIIB Brf1 subunit/transcription initiation factor TFIIB
MGNPLNRLSITGEDTKYLTRNEVSKVLNVTVQTLNNRRREGVLNPLKTGGRVLYRKEDVYNLSSNYKNQKTRKSLFINELRDNFVVPPGSFRF